jgi:2-dehydropantoate 2-reductase
MDEPYSCFYPSFMNILIYGGGAVGLGLASCLVSDDTHVDIIARDNVVSALRRDGLFRTGIFGDVWCPPSTFRAFSQMCDISSPSFYDLVLVCTKSFDSRQAATDLHSNTLLVTEDTTIILCHNGWGSFEAFTSLFPLQNILNARVITGFTRDAPNRVRITVHADDIHIGSLFTTTHPAQIIDALCGLIRNGGIPCSFTYSIEKDLWAKMLYNCSLNPLGAVLDVPYGVLGEHPSTQQLIRNIVAEIFDVMEISGYSSYWSTADDYLTAFYDTMLPPTYAHESSMLQDIRAKKTTEIEWLNGAVIRLAEKHNVSVPTNRIVYKVITCMENDFLRRLYDEDHHGKEKTLE